MEEARELIDQLGESDQEDGQLHLQRARALTSLSRHLPESDRGGVMEEAITALKRSVAEGYSDPFRVNAEPDLRPLRELESFQQILTELKAQ